jgi:hypothetical protein
VSEAKKFGTQITNSLQNIMNLGAGQDRVQPNENIQKFYEQLSEAQRKVQHYREDWRACEDSVKSLIESVKDHSDFDVVDGQIFKNFLSENMVMNYNHIELGQIGHLRDRLSQIQNQRF